MTDVNTIKKVLTEQKEIQIEGGKGSLLLESN